MPRTTIAIALSLTFYVCAVSWPVRAQSGDSSSSSSHHDDQDDSSSSSSTHHDTEDPPAKPNAKYDPLPAEQDVEVGTFYMHKGDVDAAIARFQDAIEQRPNFAKPRILLAEAYEKKAEKANAVKYYKEYLQVYPNAPDANKIRQKIEKLSKR